MPAAICDPIPSAHRRGRPAGLAAVLSLWVAAGCADEEDPPPPPPGSTMGSITGTAPGPSSGSGSGGSTTSGSTSGGTSGGGSSAGTSGSGPTSASGGTGGAQAVAIGEHFEMLRVEEHGAAGYSFDDTADLLAIACEGDDIAWVVGTGGTLLHTEDAGDTWWPVALRTRAALRAVDVTPEDDVFVVGDAGTLLVSRDEGEHFTAFPVDGVDFTGVSATSNGAVAFATSRGGAVWRFEADADRPVRVFAGDEPLRAISTTPTGDRTIAVGDAGLWLESHDDGYTWEVVDVGTARTLFAVAVGRAGLAIAVGEAGVVVRYDGSDLLVREHLDDETHLRALHMSDNGHAIAVGDAGVTFLSDATGREWSPLGMPTTYDLFGVDELSLHDQF